MAASTIYIWLSDVTSSPCQPLEYRKNKATFHASPPTGASPPADNPTLLPLTTILRLAGFALVAFAAPASGTWQEHLQDAGSLQMRHLVRLMASLTSEQYLDRIPDQRLIDGEEGQADRLTSDRLAATRGSRGDYAMVYSANGRGIRLRMEHLAGPTMDACWFNPRNGRWHAVGHEYERPTLF